MVGNPEDSSAQPVFLVVRNDVGQYSISPDWQEIPAGWHLDGFTGPETDCLGHIDAVWTNILPVSQGEART